MKHIPNILTTFRIILSIILLLFFHQVNIVFLCIFSIAAITDLFDGFLARKFNASSILGSTLDTIADVLLYSNILKIIIISNILSPQMLIYITIIFIIAFISPIISYIKFKKCYFIHSIYSKIIGFSLFFIPFSIYFNHPNEYIKLVLNLFALSIIENIIMQMILNEPNPDAKTIYHIIKEKKESKL